MTGSRTSTSIVEAGWHLRVGLQASAPRPILARCVVCTPRPSPREQTGHSTKISRVVARAVSDCMRENYPLRHTLSPSRLFQHVDIRPLRSTHWLRRCSQEVAPIRHVQWWPPPHREGTERWRSQIRRVRGPRWQHPPAPGDGVAHGRQLLTLHEGASAPTCDQYAATARRGLHSLRSAPEPEWLARQPDDATDGARDEVTPSSGRPLALQGQRAVVPGDERASSSGEHGRRSQRVDQRFVGSQSRVERPTGVPHAHDELSTPRRILSAEGVQRVDDEGRRREVLRRACRDASLDRIAFISKEKLDPVRPKISASIERPRRKLTQSETLGGSPDGR